MPDAPTWFDRVASGFDGLRKVVVAAGVTLIAIIVVAALVREYSRSRVVIDPVTVKASDAPDAPTPELAAQQIARHLNRIQHAGAEEWKRVHVDDGIHPVDLQIPGAPLSLRNAAREVLALFGRSPVTVRSALARRTPPGGYSAVMSLAGDHGSMANCPIDGLDDTLDNIFECIALSAIAATDPKMAASYVFQREQQECRKGLTTSLVPNMSDLQREEQRIQNRRDRCSFAKTQKLIAKLMEGGRKGDEDWVPYIYGQVHLARAMALAEAGLQQQLSDFDQAIGRFIAAKNKMPDSATAIAVLMEAYLAKGIAIHQSTSGLKWSDDPSSLLQTRLLRAEQTFAEAAAQLDSLPAARSAALEALVNRLDGRLIYRNWMIAAHRRMESGLVTVALGQKVELDRLAAADAKFKAADAKVPTKAAGLMDWGNILRAMGRFDEAVAIYQRASDLDPTNEGPRLNIAVAYLDRVRYGARPAPPLHVLVALGSLSDYLAWMSGGGPYDSLIPNARRILKLTGDANDAPTFDKCLSDRLAEESSTDPKIDRWRAAAAFKVCIDEAIDRINPRAAQTSG